MPWKPKARCSTPNCVQWQPCPIHARKAWATSTPRPSPAARGYDAAWARLSRQVIADQPWCSECGALGDLATDHIVARADGGTDDLDNLQVLCRPCNTAKANRAVAARRKAAR